MAPLAELIDIYGRQDTAKVPGDPEYVALCKANDSDRVFHASRDRVENIKRKLDSQAGIQTTYRKQVKHALKLFRRLVGSDESEEEICRRLAKLSYYKKWTAKQKKYFDDTCTLLPTTRDYFLSFTQRNPTGAGNPINSDHRYLIQSVGLPDPTQSADNELARMLDVFLRVSKYKFRGFFFPTHKDDSRVVKKKLEESSDRALVFVQLVQNEMFAKRYGGRPNYCKVEYERAEAEKKPMILLFADGVHPMDLIPETDVLFALDDWYQVVQGTDCLDIDFTPDATQSANVAINRKKLRDHLVESVQARREALFDNVPGDLE